MHQEDWNAAKQQLEDASRLEPSRAEPHILLARVYFRLGDEARAEQEKRIAEELRSKNVGAGETVQGRAFPAQ